MERVLGIGGVFIRASDPAALAEWYRMHLGVPIHEEWTGAMFPLSTEDDPPGAYVVWSAFERTTEYFGAPHNMAMVNFRVKDLGAMLSQLQEAGCDVERSTESGDFGSFGWVTDPEGNRIELWQPPAHPPPDA